MQRWLTYVVAGMWAVLLLGGAFRPQEAGRPLQSGPQVGQAAPDFTLTDLSGRQVTLSQFRGKPVFLNFWASWCGPCLMEMPEVERLSANLPPDAVLLTVNATQTESRRDAAAAFMQKRGYTFPVVLDPAGELELKYLTLSLPTSLFIDREGVVRARIAGPLSYSAMLGYLREAGR